MTHDIQDGNCLQLQTAELVGNALHDALQALTPAHEARNGDIVMVSRSFLSDNNPNSLPTPKEVEAWQMTKGRLMPTKLSSMDLEDRQKVALPYALTAETDAATGIVLRARRLLPLEDHNILMMALLPGAAIVARWHPDLVLGDRSHPEAREHLQANIVPFVDKRLSNHARVEVIAGLERVLGDFATWGATGRHFFDNPEKRPLTRRVRVFM